MPLVQVNIILSTLLGFNLLLAKEQIAKELRNSRSCDLIRIVYYYRLGHVLGDK